MYGSQVWIGTGPKYISQWGNAKKNTKQPKTHPKPQPTNNNKSHYFLSFSSESATIHPQTIWCPQCVGQITAGKGSLGDYL